MLSRLLNILVTLLLNGLFAAVAASLIAREMQTQFVGLLHTAGVSDLQASVVRSDNSAWASAFVMWLTVMVTLIWSRWWAKHKNWAIEAWAPMLMYLFGGVFFALGFAFLTIPIVWAGRLFSIDQRLVSTTVMLLSLLLILLLFGIVFAWVVSKMRESLTEHQVIVR